MTDVYNKLVRDKIPEIIIHQGDLPKVETLDDKSYFRALNQKLIEEVNEYLEDCNVDELADIIEVVYALVKYKELSLNDFEHMRLKKHNERGGFDDRICLVEVKRNMCSAENL